MCAFVGESGGGKTTMFNLIQRFYDPQSGKITINRTDIKKYTLHSLRKSISEVSQDVFLFNDSIEENIKYGRPDATHEEVVAAARAANAHDFIMEFPDGYNSSVGEGGGLLSGGQKQRIAIARAILKDAPILLMDEATSALDTQSEKLIQSALSKLMVGRTTFVIAHRLSTILDADMICVIKDGKIIEQGTDSELCALNGEYKKLRDIQFKTKGKK
jgi:ABC-type multidrug transport system fused ATPase/permease subunit